MKILLLKFRNIGDVLLITPLISNLKLFYPDAQIDVALNSGTQDMVRLNPNISKVLVFERAQIKSQNVISKIWSECNFFYSFRKKKYELVINLTEGDRAGFISLLTNAKIRLGYLSSNWLLRSAYTQFLPKQDFRHTIETNLDPLKVLKIPIKSKKVDIFWKDSDDQTIDKELSNIDEFIHIHPVSRWLFKCIEDQTMAKIIDFCEYELRIRVVLTADSNIYEIGKIESILNYCSSNPLNLSGKLILLIIS